MPSKKNLNLVENLVQKTKDSPAFFLTDYYGLNVSQISQLRKKVQNFGGRFEVVKNKLLKLALTKNRLPVEKAEELNAFSGPNAILWTSDDQISPLKELVEFARVNQIPKVKLGFWQGELFSRERVMEISQIPGIKELQAKLVASINSPLSKLTRTLGWNLRKLTLVLKNIKKN